jgi:hypothetical protein
VAQKELDAAKKKLAEVETRLKGALADKQQALQDRANLDRQMKQQTGQTALLQKNLEKKDAVESKRRESIMVVGGQGVLIGHLAALPGPAFPNALGCTRWPTWALPLPTPWGTHVGGPTWRARRCAIPPPIHPPPCRT